MSKPKPFTITPVILSQQECSKQRNSISHALPNLFLRKIKYKCPSLKKMDHCFDKDKSILNLSIKNSQLANSNLNINQDMPLHLPCKYKRILPSFKCLPKESSATSKLALPLFCENLLIKNSIRGEDGSQSAFDIIQRKKKEIANVAKFVKQKSCNSLLGDLNLSKRLISLTRNSSSTNGHYSQLLSNQYRKPQYSCVYIKRNQPSLDLSELIQIKRRGLNNNSIRLKNNKSFKRGIVSDPIDVLDDL